MNRREFNRLALVGTASAAFGLAGCDPVKEIITWEPTAVDALNGIESLLMANGISFNPTVTLALTVLKASLVDLLAAAQEYESTTPPPSGTLQKIETFIEDVINNFNAFLAALGLPAGSLLNIITGLIQVVLSTIVGIYNQINPKPSAAKNHILGMTVKAQGMSVAIIPYNNPTIATFKNHWNTTCQNASDGLKVPASVYMHVSFWHDHRMHI